MRRHTTARPPARPPAHLRQPARRATQRLAAPTCRYAISCAHKLGCRVFTTWEDIVNLQARMILCLVCAVMEQDLREQRRQGGGTASLRSERGSSHDVSIESIEEEAEP